MKATRNLNQYRFLFLLSQCCLTGMLMLSLFFYKERITFLDWSYQTFFILKDNQPAIQGNRFGAILTQMIPLLGARAGLSLSWIAITYSCSFVIWEIVTFHIIYFVCKNRTLAFSYLISLILVTSQSFYWAISELPQALNFFFLFLAAFESVYHTPDGGRKTVFRYILGSVCLITAVFTHPLIAPVFILCGLFYFLYFPECRKALIAFGMLFLLAVIAKVLFFTPTYDKSAFGGLKNFRYHFPDYVFLQSNKNFARYLIHFYYFLPVLFLITCYQFFRQHRIRLLLWLVAACGAYLLLINVSHAGGSDLFYIENEYLPLAVLVAIPFCKTVLPENRSGDLPKSVLPFAVVLTAISLFRIFSCHTVFTARIDWMRTIIADTRDAAHKKLIINKKHLPISILIQTWASSYEFWLLSTLETSQSRSIIIEENEGEFDWALPQNKAFISKWGTFGYQTFPAKYFRFSDTDHYVHYTPPPYR